MKILFTKSERLLSNIIMGLTQEPVSHVALDFGLFIVHSNLIGIHLEWSDNFRKHSTVVFELECSQDNESKLQNLMSKYEWQSYDFRGLFFLGVSLFLRKYFKIPLPKSNLWQSSGMYLCTEFVSEFIDEKADSMITPYKLYLKLLSTGKYKDNTLTTYNKNE